MEVALEGLVDPELTMDILDDALTMSDKKLVTEQQEEEKDLKIRRQRLAHSVERLVQVLKPTMQKGRKLPPSGAAVFAANKLKAVEVDGGRGSRAASRISKR